MNNWIDVYDYVVFDCDGVLLDSNEIKTQAFRESLPNQPPQLVEELVNYHQETGGVSRYVKLEYFFKHLKGESDDSQCASLVQEALNLFGSFCYNSLKSCDEIRGVRDTLNKLSNSSIPLAVVSGSDQNELRDILAKRELSGHFEHILGSPKSKIENMSHLENNGFFRTKGVLFGDSRADLDAAEAFALDFVFVRGKSEWKDGTEVCSSLGHRIVDDFTHCQTRHEFT